MNNIQNDIIKYLQDVMLSIGTIDSPDDDINNTHSLNISSLKCIRKNEISKDEIKIHMFQLSRNGEISGIIDIEHDFREENEKIEIDTDIHIQNLGHEKLFCILIYEKDLPIVFDSDDLIGLLVFLSNTEVLTFSGDYSEDKEPVKHRLKTGKRKELTLDADSNGYYRIDITVLNQYD